MKVYTCKCLPNGLEFAGVVSAENEMDAKVKLKEVVESKGWEVELDSIELEEFDVLSDNARIIDPLTDYDEINKR